MHLITFVSGSDNPVSVPSLSLDLEGLNEDDDDDVEVEDDEDVLLLLALGWMASGLTVPTTTLKRRTSS